MSNISDNTILANRIGFVAAMDPVTFSEAEFQTKKARRTRLETQSCG